MILQNLKSHIKQLKAGAEVVNDISGGLFDDRMFDVVGELNAAYVLMHIKGSPENMQNNPFYDDVVTEVYDHLSERVELAEKKGIKQIFVDPGIGFGKRVSDNYELLKRLDEFKSIGYPIFVGLSKKSFIGKALNKGVNDRENSTTVAETIAISKGARLIRTHNVKKRS